MYKYKKDQEKNDGMNQRPSQLIWGIHNLEGISTHGFLALENIQSMTTTYKHPSSHYIPNTNEEMKKPSMIIHLILKTSDNRKVCLSTEIPQSPLPFLLTALMLNMMSCMLLEEVFLQVKKEQGKPTWRGWEDTSCLFIYFFKYKKAEYLKHPLPKCFSIY